jgi:hypothetical protein
MNSQRPWRGRVAVGLLDRRPGRRADVREEQRRADLGSDLVQVAIAPRRRDAAIEAGRLPLAVPAEAEAIGVGLPAGQPVAAALLDERVLRVVEQDLGVDRIAEVGHPPAHATTVRRCGAEQVQPFE